MRKVYHMLHIRENVLGAFSFKIMKEGVGLGVGTQPFNYWKGNLSRILFQQLLSFDCISTCATL